MTCGHDGECSEGWSSARIGELWHVNGPQLRRIAEWVGEEEEEEEVEVEVVVVVSIYSTCCPILGRPDHNLRCCKSSVEQVCTVSLAW